MNKMYLLECKGYFAVKGCTALSLVYNKYYYFMWKKFEFICAASVL